MSSLFDDSFLAHLEPADGPPPPPEETPAPEPVPHDLFGGHFDVPVERDAYYRDGAHRPVLDAAALLEGLNEQQRAAVEHAGARCSSSRAPVPARPGC